MSHLKSSFFLFVVCVLPLLLTACDSSTGIIESESDPSAGIESPSLANAISSERGNELSFSIDFHGDAVRSYQQGNTPLFDEIADDPSDLRGPDGEIDFTGSVDNDGLGSFSLSNSSTQMLSGSESQIYGSDFSYNFSSLYQDLQGNTFSWNLGEDIYPYLDDDAPIRYSTALQDFVDAILLDDGDGDDGGAVAAAVVAAVVAAVAAAVLKTARSSLKAMMLRCVTILNRKGTPSKR